MVLIYGQPRVIKSLQENSIVVTVAPDRGDKYLSTSAYKL